MQQQRIASIRTFLGLLCAAALLVAGAAGAAEPDRAPAQITGMVGNAHAGDDEAFVAHAALGEDGKVITDPDANCSMLLDQNALVELCGDTALQLTRRSDTGQRIVKLDRGEIRMVVEPRSDDERIEIHTPAAIATILGTVIHVKVNPDGSTDWSGGENDMSLRPTEGSTAKGTTILRAGETITLMPGEDIDRSKVRKMDPQAFAGLGSCLGDLRQAAEHIDHVVSQAKATTRVAAADADAIGDTDVAAMAGNLDPGPEIDDPGDDKTGTNTGDTYESTDGVGEVLMQGPAPPRNLPPCPPGGPPGGQCGF